MSTANIDNKLKLNSKDENNQNLLKNSLNSQISTNVQNYNEYF